LKKGGEKRRKKVRRGKEEEEAETVRHRGITLYIQPLHILKLDNP